MNEIERNEYIHLTTRQRILEILEQYSAEQLNTIPPGFANNLIWNAGHVLVTQHLLTYGLCNLPLELPTEMIEQYRKGSKPEKAVSAKEIAEIKTLLIDSNKTLFHNYKKGIFKEFREYETSFGARLTSIEMAIAFNNTHESLHMGYMLALRKGLPAS